MLHSFILPVVKPETCFSVEHEIEDNEKTFIRRSLHHLMSNNPILGMWIKQYAKSSKDPKSTMICALVLYKLLESQEEADFMNDNF
jgi:hypothetical protein